MYPKSLGWLFFVTGFLLVVFLVPEPALAYEFQSRTQALTSNLISTVLPLVSTLGLVYAAILALTGDAGAKARIVGVVVASMCGFLAPHFINWLKAAAGQ